MSVNNLIIDITVDFDNFCLFSLRVNLDMGKAFYSWSMQRDVEMPDTVVRFVVVRLLCLFSHFFFIYFLVSP